MDCGAKVMGTPPLSHETEMRVVLLFPPEEQERVRVILVDECGHNIPGFRKAGSLDIERLRFAALKVSEGRMDKLSEAVDLAKIDFRDLLMWAGFGDLESYKSWIPGRKW
jgi:hypothetical protein